MDDASQSRESPHGNSQQSQQGNQRGVGGAASLPGSSSPATATAATPTVSSVKPACAPIRTSARVSKKLKLDLPLNSKKEPAKKEEEPGDTKQGTPEAKRRRRNWELWSVEDKNVFFEALNEFGKDFDAIQNHFGLKMKKKGMPEHMVKNKDQVRHFYYRTWHKISKYIKFSDDLKKVTQELYALINYGELRKKLGRSLLEKSFVKLHELIYRGTTQIKVRGKTVRVKTPLCRALRRLNQLDENTELLKLPPRVSVELRPLNNEAWGVVHASAQNPRVRSSLPLQHRLSALITFLQHRWQLHDSKYLDKLLSSGEIPAPRSRPGRLLRLSPRAGVRILLPAVNFNEYLTSSSLSLQTHEERLLGGLSLDHTLPSGKGRSGNVKGSRGKKKGGDVEAKKQSAREKTECAGETGEDKTRNGGSSLDQIHANAVEQILSLQLEGDDATDRDIRSSPLPAEMTEESLQTKEEPSVSEEKDREASLAKIKAGWTTECANTLTVGELYMMFGGDGKLLLEYSWEPPSEDHVPLISGEQPEATATVPLPLSVASAKPGASVPDFVRKLASLARLLSTTKEKPSCPCGHICGKGSSRSQSGPRHRASSKPKAFSADDSVRVPVMQCSATTALPSEGSVRPGPSAMAYQAATSAYQKSGVVPISNLQDGVFRRPLLAPSQVKQHPNSSAEEAFKAQLDKFRPRYCNRPGRTSRKNVVVQRMLPLLPKSPNGSNMVTLKVMPQTGEFRPINTHPVNPRLLSFGPVPLMNSAPIPVMKPAASSPGVMLPVTQGQLNAHLAMVTNQQQAVLTAGTPTLITGAHPPSPLSASTRSVPSLSQVIPSTAGEQQHRPPASLDTSASDACLVPTLGPSSPPSITSLLGLGPEELSLGADSTTLLDVPLNNPAPSFTGMLGSEDRTNDSVPGGLLQSRGHTPPISPSHILKEDPHWLNSEVVDFSLSSFLSHLDSPLKGGSSSSLSVVTTNEDTRMSQDVEAQLQCLMSENSIDYMAKFADLAAQIASDTSSKK